MVIFFPIVNVVLECWNVVPVRVRSELLKELYGNNVGLDTLKIYHPYLSLDLARFCNFHLGLCPPVIRAILFNEL